MQPRCHPRSRPATTPLNGYGVCGRRPQTPCVLKRHTELLRRYGHFGKVPTSLALAITEAGANDLDDLRQKTLRDHRTRHARALALERHLKAAWRVSDKIASMFLSLVTNPDLADVPGPWNLGTDWRHFVCIDSNVDLWLRSVGFAGPWTYAARRGFLQQLSAKIPLRDRDRRLHDDNPRLVQQAMYMFMSRSNRLNASDDCAHGRPESCRPCPRSLRGRCPFTKRLD